MHKLLYPRLAAQNIKRDAQFYLPYLLTIIGTSAAFYITVALSMAPDLPNSTRYAYLSMFLTLGSFIIAVFAAIFLFYTNSFLMKRRNKELGLYSILGMGKRHIAVILGFETLYLGLGGILGGLLAGMLLQRLVSLLVCRIMRCETYFSFYISVPGIVSTCSVFCVILLAALLGNLIRICRQDPIALLRESSAGEREPKTRWLLVVIGTAALGGGYFIAVTTRTAFAAFSMYFLAVLLVIIGTYCLFTSISIAVLKLLRKNKRYYYQAPHFIGISGMLHRMKRNAVGLANICILSTMVMVMVSGTLSLYLGSEEVLDARYHGDIRVEVRYDPYAEAVFSPSAMSEQLTAQMRSAGAPAASFVGGLRYLAFMTQVEDGVFTAGHNFSSSESTCLNFTTAAEYAAMTGGQAPQLEPGQIWLYFTGGQLDTLDLRFPSEDGGEGTVCHFEVVNRMSGFPASADASLSLLDYCWAVLPDEAALLDLYDRQLAAFGENASLAHWTGCWNSGAGEDAQPALSEMLEYAAGDTDAGSWSYLKVDDRASFAGDYYSLNGGFFFLGIFLGLILLMAMVMIIYYKQISEGYEDRERFRIMQQVGMEQRMIRKSINSQVLSVFFLPLLVAGVHVAFDFSLMIRLLTMFGLRNVTLTLVCTLATFLAFALVYGAVYLLTARVYYRIVR